MMMTRLAVFNTDEVTAPTWLVKAKAFGKTRNVRINVPDAHMSNHTNKNLTEFIVNVKHETRKDKVGKKRVQSVHFDGVVPLLRKSRKLLDDDERNRAGKGNNVHDSVDIGFIHVLAGVALE